MRDPSQVESARFLALADTLAAGTPPVLSISWRPAGGAPGVSLEFDPSVTPSQRSEAEATVAAWDWGAEADTNARKAAAKARAKTAFADTLDPIATAARNADRALFRSLKQTKEKLNEVIAWINANGGNISTLTNRSFARAMQGAAQLVDAETDPAGD